MIFLGITNYEEYSLIQETVEEKKEEGTGTLKKDRTLLRDERKMEKLKAKLHTDDDCEYLRRGAVQAQGLAPHFPSVIGVTQGGVGWLVSEFYPWLFWSVSLKDKTLKEKKQWLLMAFHF